MTFLLQYITDLKLKIPVVTTVFCVVIPQERELQEAVQRSNVEELKAEIEQLQKEKSELDRAQRQLDQEIQLLNMHTTARTQMDMLKRDKV